MQSLNRRDFIKLSAGVSVASFVWPGELLANDGSSFNDFKALVVVELGGGNDALNMFIPADDATGSTTGYDQYAQARTQAVRVADNDLMGALRSATNNGALEFGSASANPYYAKGDIRQSYVKGFYRLDKAFKNRVAVHAMMPEIAYWLDRGKGAIVQNVGSIIAPSTKSDLRSGKVERPPFLFAHNQQARLARIGQAHSINIPTGWLGLVADAWRDINPSTIYAQNINLSKYGKFKMFFGNETMPMTYSSRGPTGFKDLRADMHKSIDDLNGDMFANLYRQTQKAIILQTEKTVQDWAGVSGSNDPFASLSDVYGNPMVSNGVNKKPSTAQYGLDKSVNVNFIDAFMTAVKLIKIAKSEGLKRVAISITLGGFDQHSTQATTHPQRIRGFSLGVDRLMKGLEKIGELDNTTMFTVSEFARSTGSNADGTDHAWGGAQLVLGGAVRSGNYGTFPDLTLGGDQDYANKGRLIPTTSFSQYYATLLKWFGGDNALIQKALPEIVNFSTKDLGFMKT